MCDPRSRPVFTSFDEEEAWFAQFSDIDVDIYVPEMVEPIDEDIPIDNIIGCGDPFCTYCGIN